MILDRKNKVIYAALSERTTAPMVKKEAEILHYKAITFNASDTENRAIYHTNVMMGIGEKLAVVCLECIKSKKERALVTQQLKQNNKAIINISEAQVSHMCGNVLEVANHHNTRVMVMSQQAYEHFTPKQKTVMRQVDKILPVNIATIETVGGGSARCMMAEIYRK